LSLAGKKVAVVGGTSGIGMAVAEAAAENGAKVIVVGRDRARVDAAAERLGGAALGMVADARDSVAIANLFKEIGTVDHVAMTVSASASRLGVNRAMAAMEPGAAGEFFSGKFWAQYWTAKAAIGALAPDGSIVFTSGIAAKKVLPNHTIISANNAAIEAVVKQLAREIAPRRVNAISPGLTNTRAYDHLSDEDRVRFFDRVTSRLPLERVAEPREIAQAYLFAMTATYLTGTVVEVDGGLLVE